MKSSEILKGILPVLIEAYKRGEDQKDLTEATFKDAGSQTITEAINTVRNSRTKSDGHERYYRVDTFVTKKAEIPGIDSKLIMLYVFLVRKHQQMDFGKESVQTRVLLLDEVIPKQVKDGFKSDTEKCKLYSLIVNITTSRVEKALHPKAEEKSHKERADILLKQYLPDL